LTHFDNTNLTIQRERKSFSEKHLPTKRKSKSTDDLTRITSTSTGGHSGNRKKLSNNGSILLIDTTTTSLVKVGEGPAKRGSIHGSKGKALAWYWLVAGWLLVAYWLVTGWLLVAYWLLTGWYCFNQKTGF